MSEPFSDGVVMTGGCQCGAVRYALSAVPETEFCHCRMCQRAVGGVFAALSGVKKSELVWTRGEPTDYASSTLSSGVSAPPAERR